MLVKRENELLDKLHYEKSSTYKTYEVLNQVRLKSQRDEYLAQHLRLKDQDRLLNKEAEARARPYHQLQEVDKYNRGDFPYFYNQSKIVKHQLDDTRYNTKFKVHPREI